MWILFLLIIGILYFLFSMLTSNASNQDILNQQKGERAEINLVKILIKASISPKVIFHNLYIINGKYSTQIDVVILTKAGIIVFEVKDYSGWIFGNGKNKYWTQVLSYGKQKYRFYNPVMQNNKHIKDLKKQLLQFKNIPFYSIIVFSGDCKLKNISLIPKNTFITSKSRVIEVVNFIIKNNPPASYGNKNEIMNLLHTLSENSKSKEIVRNHIDNIEDMKDKGKLFN
jgi:hypothetical protein